jgi:hypothetical protein
MSWAQASSFFSRVVSTPSASTSAPGEFFLRVCSNVQKRHSV